MPMGSTNVLATHQQHIMDALQDYIGIFCYVYLDNIVILSDGFEDHIDKTWLVFATLCKVKIYCNLMKTTLFGGSIEFLGHIISAAGIQANLRKCEKVTNWPKPKTASNVCSFIGLTPLSLSPWTGRTYKHSDTADNERCGSQFPDLDHGTSGCVQCD